MSFLSFVQGWIKSISDNLPRRIISTSEYNFPLVFCLITKKQSQGAIKWQSRKDEPLKAGEINAELIRS